MSNVISNRECLIKHNMWHMPRARGGWVMINRLCAPEHWVMQRDSGHKQQPQMCCQPMSALAQHHHVPGSVSDLHVICIQSRAFLSLIHILLLERISPNKKFSTNHNKTITWKQLYVGGTNLSGFLFLSSKFQFSNLLTFWHWFLFFPKVQQVNQTNPKKQSQEQSLSLILQVMDHTYEQMTHKGLATKHGMVV